MMTLTTHLIGVEAEKQIEMTGPIKESMGSWIERLCGDLVEDTRTRLVDRKERDRKKRREKEKRRKETKKIRRRVCVSPEVTMIRNYLLKHYLRCHSDEIPQYLNPKRKMFPSLSFLSRFKNNKKERKKEKIPQN